MASTIFQSMISGIVILLSLVQAVSAADSATAKLDTIRVRESRRTRSVIDVQAKEEIIGRTDDLSNLLVLTPGVTRVSSGGSRLVVHGDGPYDNMASLRGIRIFLPAHFTDNKWVDRLAVPVAAANKITFETSDLSGRYSGSSGSILLIDPWIREIQKLISRPELTINCADLTLKLPFRKGLDLYQCTFRPSDRYAFWSRMDEAADNLYPSNYTDLQLVGEQRFGSIKTEQLIWLSRDTYFQPTDYRPFINPALRSSPWGIASVSIGDTVKSRAWRLSAGGTDQVYSEKDIDYWYRGRFLIAKSIHRRSGSLSLESTPGSCNETRFSSRFFAEYVDWSGSVERLPAQFYDQPLLPDTTRIFRQGQTALISMHLGASRANDFFLYGIDLNEGLFAPGPHAFLDPGSIRYRTSTDPLKIQTAPESGAGSC